jgi:hemerythrin-like domain-containing protein
MKATDELVKEHQGIELMLRIMQAVAEKLKGGDRIPAGELSSILEFLSVFVDQCHHGKEEEFLFPALEAAGVARVGGPIGVMLKEHEQGRRLVSHLRDAVTGYTSGDDAASSDIQSTIGEYEALLTQHIEKENKVLFPMADARLDSTKDHALFEAFENLERDRIGPGKHEAFHALLDQLQGAYLT